MSQTKKGSISEAIANIIPGYLINYAGNIAVLPIFCGQIVNESKAHDGVGLFETFTYIGIIYTFISIARQYLLRRAFNRLGKDGDFYTMLLLLCKKIKHVGNHHDR